MTRADSTVESGDRPRISGCSFPANAVSGVFGLMSEPRAAPGRVVVATASMMTTARQSMKHLQNQKNKQKKIGRITPSFERRCQYSPIAAWGEASEPA